MFLYKAYSYSKTQDKKKDMDITQHKEYVVYNLLLLSVRAIRCLFDLKSAESLILD